MSNNAIKAYENLMAKINEAYPTLSNRLKDIASFALEHPTSMALETIATIAEEAKVPPSALIRFGKALGYNGFSEMQRVFQSYVAVQTASYKERIHQDMVDLDNEEENSPVSLLAKYCKENIISLEHLRNGISPHSLTKAVRLIKEADHIYLSGVRRSLPVATYLSYMLSHAGCKAHLLDGIGGMLTEQCSNIEDSDLLIVTSFHPYSSEAQNIVQQALEKNIPLIAISDNNLSPICRNADVAFIVHDAEVHSFRSLTATMVLAQTLATSLLFS
ncbi:hypothetical protein RJ43_12455 [Alteromonas macleodii]|uniref:MurR/RpiR family transcriptional regulator n=1 Tax=Alteromonas macleodii TaxID=28108 RepID=UPI000580123F|nr:MurR/RpiR family transcriptional regulator [Alteromonas macleodii]KHT51472.1 hypothetical protein RJ43_12455 [Alteromonas macleodii]